MNTQHTPGPWEYIAGQVRVSTPAALTTGRHLIAEIFRLDQCADPYKTLELPHDKEADANARVIAAAPDLLAACKSVLRALLDNLVPGPMDDDAKAALRAAIARAQPSTLNPQP